jgi:DNA-binding NarL/FixJ family response regulator
MIEDEDLDGLQPWWDLAPISMAVTHPNHGSLLCRVIALTANAMPSDREQCLASGLHEYMSKPLDIEVLRKVMNQFCGRKLPRVEVAEMEIDSGGMVPQELAAIAVESG